MRPTTIRIVTLALALAAPAAQACAVAEGCPMGDPPRSCATVRIDADHVCIDDPTAPGGVLILPRGGTVPADAPDCGLAGGGCVMPLAGRADWRRATPRAQGPRCRSSVSLP